MNKITGFIVILLVLIIGVMSMMFSVHETKQALVIEFGNPKRVIRDAGLNFKLPWENVVQLDKRILSLDIPVQEVIASDQKRLLVDAFARFQIIDPLLTYQTSTSEAGAAGRLQTLLSSNLKNVLGDRAFSTLLSGKRAEMMSLIQERVNKEAKTFGIDVIDVRIKRADLPVANSQAIFDRMNAERRRDAQQARSEGQEQAIRIRAEADRSVTVTIANAEKKAQELRGEGDAKSIDIFAKAYGQDEAFFEFYRSLQAYEKAMGSKDTSMVISPDSEFFKYLGVENKDGAKRNNR